MEIIDSHCHLDKLDLTEFDNNFDNMLKVAKEYHINKFLCISIDLNNFSTILALTKKYPQIYASVGLHPTEDKLPNPSIAELLELANNNKVIAIGETGLDYFHIEKDNAEWQRQRFKDHIKVSNSCNKPLIIHTRNAKNDTIKIMRSENAKIGIMHCFSEDLLTAQQAIEMGFYISFSGIITFNSAHKLREIAKHIPLDRLLVETDSPYLTPAPNRGKSNHPANTYFVVEKLAQLRNVSINEMAKITTDNFNKLFNL